MPATSVGLAKWLILLPPLRELMKQTRQAVRAIKQSILLRCLWIKQTRTERGATEEAAKKGFHSF